MCDPALDLLQFMQRLDQFVLRFFERLCRLVCSVACSSSSPGLSASSGGFSSSLSA